MMGYSWRARGGRVGAGADQQMQIGAVRGLCGAPSLVSLVSTIGAPQRKTRHVRL